MDRDGINRYFPDDARRYDADRAVLAELIRSAWFKPVRFVEGYDMSEVDALLDRLVEALDAGQPVRPTIAAAAFTATRIREGYSRADVDTLLAEVARAAQA